MLIPAVLGLAYDKQSPVVHYDSYNLDLFTLIVLKVKMRNELCFAIDYLKMSHLNIDRLSYRSNSNFYVSCSTLKIKNNNICMSTLKLPCSC